MDILVGLIAIVGGLAIMFAGLPYFYLLLPVWGFIVGFVTGAAATTAIFGDSFLATGLSWIIGFVVAIGFALLSYLYWYFGVIATAGLAGGLLGASLFAAIGVDRAWVLFIIGVIVGIAFALAALVLDLPVYMVIVNTALAGAAFVIGGVLLLFNKIDRDELGTAALWHQINDKWYLWIVWVVAAAIGMGVQLTRRAVVQAILPDERWVRLEYPQR